MNRRRFIGKIASFLGVAAAAPVVAKELLKPDEKPISISVGNTNPISFPTTVTPGFLAYTTGGFMFYDGYYKATTLSGDCRYDFTLVP